MTTITINRALLEGTLEALRELLPDQRDSNCGGYDARDVRQWRATVTALQSVLAEPVEPVGTIVPDQSTEKECVDGTCVYLNDIGKNLPVGTLLYTSARSGDMDVQRRVLA